MLFSGEYVVVVWQTYRPSPRWHHTAHMINDRVMLVLGGFSADKVSRYFNDLWFYDTKSEKWSQPSQAETTPDQNGLPTLNRPWPGVPEPRGAHASALVCKRRGDASSGKKLMVFGGYGGAGRARRARERESVFCVWFEKDTLFHRLRGGERDAPFFSSFSSESLFFSRF